MAFEPKPLDPSTIDWNNSKDTPAWIEGKGQRIYWKEAIVSIADKEGGGGTALDEKFQTGWGYVAEGTELYISGKPGAKPGKVKEVS